MFDAIRNIAYNAIDLDRDAIFSAILGNKELQEYILDLNRNDQLFEKGINALGVRLDTIGGGYRPKTVKIKQGKGQPVDRVTLKDTGKFYDSFYITIGLHEFYIDADPYKQSYDGEADNLFERWGEDVLGLTDESIEKLGEFIKDELVPKVIELLLAA